MTKRDGDRRSLSLDDYYYFYTLIREKVCSIQKFHGSFSPATPILAHFQIGAHFQNHGSFSFSVAKFNFQRCTNVVKHPYTTASIFVYDNNMYITYETTHSNWDEKRKNHGKYFYQPPIQVPDVLPKTKFMPSKLLCISSMEVVKGFKVNQGYCALSYSWNQSGLIVEDYQGTGKAERFDNGEHCIFRRKQDAGPYGDDAVKEFVQFEEIIRQICIDSNIKYIWYDQKCINQNDTKEKQEEISQMHEVYSNAYCTIALIPEFYAENYRHLYNNAVLKLHQTEIFGRLWTLEEAIKSRRMLIVGRNVKMWANELNLINNFSITECRSALVINRIQRCYYNTYIVLFQS
ncbi:hypothetical protein BDA99DRAFT_534422 [Phascolomyces articulosus]|uniref:Heterokaryon incompatibility domain-containing protein n=1 Tax=Phascolomyces articulosus TaxID=60185 RepID=A0AAD5K7F2_9FUNG|nr:hypothetical protein BDA99DRAFT_534422 [Phascolomyces articulosus]